MSVASLSSLGYLFKSFRRQSERPGGDTGILFHDYFVASFVLGKSMIVLNSLNGFSKPPIPSIVVYRSTSPPVFLDEFSIYLENVIMCPEPLIIAGDFNFHLDLVHSNNSRRFEELLETFGLSLWACPGSCHHPIH